MKRQDFPGTFIVIEGADGAGTTTQSKKLSNYLNSHLTQEPTSNEVGEKIEEMISCSDYSPETVALGFAADRKVHLEEEIIPRLRKGETVVCDRYYHSSLVYQPTSGADYEWVMSINKEALVPDLTIILDVTAEEGMERVEERGKDGNIFEDLSFQQEVVLKYRDLESKLDEDISLVDASQSKTEVFNSIRKVVNQTNIP